MVSNDKTISINSDTCIKCRKCVRVCPAGVMNQESKGDPIEVKYTESCIACGHCVDVCPTNSVLHSVFPKERIHTIDYSKLPTPEQVMLLMKSRRSNRVLTSKPIPEEALNQIVQAAYYAPTASNSRQVSVAVVTDPEVLRRVSSMTVDVFDSVIKRLDLPVVRWVLKPFLRDVYASIPAFHRYKTQHLAGSDPILRNATALLIFHTPKTDEFGCQNANLAYQNASLMAQSLGVSQIFMGFVIRAIKRGHRKTFSRMVGVEGKVQAIMALGIPAFRFPNYSK